MAIKKIDIKEFREKGYLQEVNRRFFHPLGMALAISSDDKTKKESIAFIFDARDDKDGFEFGIKDFSEKEFIDFKAKERFIDKEFFKKKKNRIELFGSFIEPVTRG